VFACFGSAAQHAQLFEQALGAFLDADNRVSGKSLTADELEKKTMGQLLHEMRRHVRFNESRPDDCMSAALACRNFLMHKYFLEREEAMKTEDGRLRMLAELVGMERILDAARVTANAVRIALCQTLGIEDTAKQAAAYKDMG
jgi:hypothetical protein